MENDEKIKEKNKNKIIEDSTKDINIYFISCFHNDLYEEGLFKFNFTNPDIDRIVLEKSYELKIENQTSTAKIFCIHFKEGKKKPKSISLSFTCDSSVFWELNELSLKETTKFIFGNISLMEKNIHKFILYSNNKLNKKNIKRSNYYYNLCFEKKLDIYCNFLKKITEKNNTKLKEYNESLVSDSINNMTKINLNKLNFSNAINLFCLSYSNKYILKTLEKFSDIIFIKDKFNNKDFSNLINIYNTDKNAFFEPLKNLNKKNKDKYEKYKKLMNNFVFEYFIFYEKERIIKDKKLCLKSEKPLMKIINKRDTIIETAKILTDYLDLLYIIFKEKNNEEKDKSKNYMFIIYNDNNLENINFNNLHDYYIKIAEFQKEKKEYFLDFSLMIDKFIELYNNKINYLKYLFVTFEYEFEQNKNFKLRNKLNNYFYRRGTYLIQNGKLENEGILDFISYSEIYLSNKKNKITKNEFLKIYNDDYKKKKKIDILKGINIKSKKDLIISKIKKYEVYKYFYSDMGGEYINIFKDKISDIQNLGIFFILLPKNYYNHDSLIALKEWIYKNINSFSIANCKAFKEEINTFMEILIKVAMEYIDQFLNFLIQNLGEYCMELFIYLLNNNKDLNYLIKRSLIMFYISTSINNYSFEHSYNIDNIIYFIEHLETEDNNTITIFLNEIGNILFNEKDFFSVEIKDSYRLFEILLLHKKKFILNQLGDYLNNIKAICEELYNKLKNLNIIYYEIIPFMTQSSIELSKDKIKYILFFLSKKERIEEDIINERNQIFDNLQKQFIIIKSKIKELAETITFLDDFFSENIEKQEEKNKIHNLINFIYNKTISEIIFSKEINQQMNGFQGLIKEAKKNLEKKKNSLLFLEIYNSNKKIIKDQNYLFELTCNEFNSAINIIYEDPEKIQNNNYIKFFYEIAFNNEKNLDKEINWIINYQKTEIAEDRKNKLLSSLKLLVKKENIINIIKGILILKEIYESNLNQTEEEKMFFDELKNQSQLLIENISSNKIKEVINYISGKFKEITFNNDDKNYKNKILVFFKSINKNKDCFYFFKEKKLENIENLREFLLDSDETELSLYDIEEFFKVVRFLNKDIGEIKSSFELIQIFISGILNKDKFESYLHVINKYNKIKSLFDKFLKGEGGIFTKIKDIMSLSQFVLNLSEIKNIYEINGRYVKTNIQQKTFYIKSEELDDLFQRVFISIKRDNSNLYIKRFIQYYKEIKVLNNLINKIYLVYGYPEEIFIYFKIVKLEITCKYNNIEYESKNLINLFKRIKTKCKSIFTKSIENSDEIRLFYGRQLYFINKYLSKNKYEEIYDLINCSTNGLLNKFNIDFNKEEELDKEKVYETMINNISKYIKELFLYNKKKIEDIYLKNVIINSNNYYKGFYFFGCSLEEYDVLSFYFNLTGNPPSNSNLLYCNKETSIEEINIFFIKAIYCNINSLFIIIIPDYLSSNQKTHLIKSLKKKAKQNCEMMKSCLIILFNLKDTEFHHSILKIKNIKLAENLSSFMKANLEDINVELISSKICGLGKSTIISKKAEKNRKIIYLHIGGEMSKNELIQMVRKAFQDKVYSKSINYILHINLKQSNNTNLIKDFLFNLLILKKCEINENRIYIGSNINIYIELENNYYSYLNTYKILSIFSEKSINKISNIELNEKTKLVSTILSLFDSNEIKDRNIILEKDFKYKNQYEKIILKHLGIKNPNFYQINTFINILACEFEKFNSNLGFSPDYFKENHNAMGMSIEEALKLRSLIIGSLIKVTKYFTIGPYENLIKTQNSTKSFLNSENNNINLINSLKIEINSITYDDIKPSLVVFNNDNLSVTILTTCSEKEDEFKNLEKLYNSQDIEYQKLINQGIKPKSKLKNLKNLDNKSILKMLTNFLDVKYSSEQEIKKIIGNYVYTVDNFIKVILILLRIRAKVPVIMMGETGCGKTTLIEMAFNLINKGQFPIKKLNIHAGTNDEDIINFIEKITKEVEEENKILSDLEIKDFQNMPKKQRDEYKDESIIINNIKDKIYKREIWVFFDEINTCNSLGLLSEILCNHSCRGKPINEQFIFLAACNPYRCLLKERKMDAILFHKNAKKNKLVYSVNPLPHSLLNYVFNFGNLKTEDEKKYIESMANQTTKSFFMNYETDNNEKILCDQIIKKQIDCISIAQNFVKENNDVSLVSLREVNRFLIFFKFFVDFIQKRNQDDENFNGEGFFLFQDDIVALYKNKSKIFYLEAAINLSLFICYYLRLPDMESRMQLEEKLNSFFGGNFLKIPSLEMDYVVNNFIIPKGISKNQALKENLFSALYCIVNKIPLIICGKPGRSKTLSIQILQTSLKGKEGSNSYLCKLFPELIIYKIQGALNTKTDEVIKIFNKAREAQKLQFNKDKLHLVLMDEMGLAELSPNNPLKVTHYELENEKEKVPFVGITNWALDASKMNRVIFIVVQEPDEEDLIITAKEIVKSYEINQENYYEKYGYIFNYLSKAYYRFIEDKKTKNDENKYFHGSRDFYSLIKNVISDIIKKKNILDKNHDNDKEILNKICLKNIERNFGGLENSIEEFKTYFIELLNYEKKCENSKEYELLDCLKDSLYDNESRYLLMISDSSISKDILNCMIDEINNQIIKANSQNIIQEGNIKNIRKKEVKIFLGSKFKSDEKSIYYCDDILYKIKCQMETENILILKDLEIVYPSLYELFNRSFINLQGVKFARLGKSKSLSLVNDNFKVITLVNKKDISKEDPPFLNRFEKHIISFTNILNNKLLSLADEIYLILKEIISFNFVMNEKGELNNNYKFNEFNLFLNNNIKFINNEEVRGLVYLSSKNGITSKNEIIKFILNKISPTLTEDLIIIMQKFGFKAKYNFYYENIINIYKNNYRYNFKNFIEQTDKKLSIIYTFSFINDSLFENNEEEFNNKFFLEKINKKSIMEIKIEEINSINIVEKNVINFITEKNYNLCVIRFKEEDLIKLEDVHNMLNDCISKEKDMNIIQEIKSKIYVILIHLSRVKVYYKLKSNIKKNIKEINNLNNNYISFLSQTPQYFIDNLNNKYSNFLDILSYSNENIIANIIKKNCMLERQITHSIRFFSYILINSEKLIRENNQLKDNLKRHGKNYREILIYRILFIQDLKNFIFNGLISFFKNEEDLLKIIYYKNIISREDADFLDTLNVYIEQKTKSYLLKLIYLLDQKQILQCFVVNENILDYKLVLDEINIYISNIYNINTNKLNLDGININNKIETKILYGIKIPFIQNIISENILNFIKNNIEKDYLENENNLIRKRISNENIDFEKSKYLNEMKQLNNKLKNELNNCPLIINILKSGNIQLIKDLFNDCFHVFLMKSNIFKDDYDSLIEMLEIIIQLRLKTRMNNDLNIDCFLDINNEMIPIFPSFLELFNNNIFDGNKIIEGNSKKNKIKMLDDDEEEEKNFYLDLFLNVINFIQCYSKEIYNILEIFYFLNKQIGSKDCLNEIKLLIMKKKIILEINDRNPEYSQINKINFFLIIESLLKQIISIMKNKNFFSIYSYFKDMKCYISNIFKIEKQFLLFSKELFTFEIIIKIFDYYEKIKKEEEDLNIKEYEIVIKLIMESSELLISKEYNKLNDNLISINYYLKIIFEKYIDKYAELMISIMINRYKLIDEKNCRENIVKLLVPEKSELYNQKLIEKSYPLISIIFDKPEPEIYKPKDNLEKYTNKFLGFTSNLNDKKFYLKKILNKDYPGLNEIIIYFYENCCENYFKKIKNSEKNEATLSQKLCQEMSKKYLKLAINYIKDNFESNGIKKDTLYFLGKYYSIAYIKRYLNNYINIIMDNNYQYLDERIDINSILFSEKTKIANEIKFYALKLCLERCNNNYENFLKFINEDTIFQDYFNKMNLNDSKVFFYSLLPFLNIQEKKEKIDFQLYKNFYENIQMNEKKDVPKEFKKLKIKDIIYSYLYFNFYKFYITNIPENEKKEFLISLLKSKSNSEEEQFKNLLFNEEALNSKILPKLGIRDIKKKNPKKIEILFYAFRFVFNILCEGNSNNFYYSLLTKNATNKINENMIPGKLSNTNEFIKSFDIININFKKDPNYSAYLCSCGYHYTIDYCSFPMREFSCPKCNKIIGGKSHILHRREGHKRIFFNNQYKDKILSAPYADKTIPYILLKDLEMEVNNKKNELFKGLKKEAKDYFLERRSKVREMSYITFRILNFILHGFILYSNIQGYISDDYLDNNLIESMSCFEIMEKDWEIIDEELKIKQIPNIQIFMNVIFDKVILVLNRQKNFSNDIKLNNFENEVEKIVNENLINNTLIEEYINNNNIMTDNIDISNKLIILENENINIEKEFPDMKFFKKTKLPKLEDFINDFNSLEENKEYYPIISYFIDKNSNIRNLEYLTTINNLCNYMINFCSYRYTREEAKKIKIKDEIKTMDDLIAKFIKIYSKLRPLINQIDCHELKDRNGDLLFNDLENNQNLFNFCVDIGEFNYGIVLTAIYKKMINWQNQFINVVLNSKNINHKNYSKQFEQEIMIQDCSEDDIIKFPMKNIVNDIITENSYQKNYGIIFYNYDLIEEQLASIILPSIKKLISDNENCLRYVIFQFEGFRGNKTNIITKYIEKYKTKELNNEELEIILNYKNNHDNKRILKILFSLQILIDIILENNIDKNELISNVIEENIENENNEILKELFNSDKDKKLFTINTLINVYNIFEIICWEKIKDTLINSYQMKLNDNIKENINKFFKKEKELNDNLNNPKLITKRNLSTAIRRFISRYLSGKRDEEINEKNSLMPYLRKQELWDIYGFVDNEEFEVELTEIFSEDGNNSSVYVGHATNLYEFLGGDKDLLKEYFSKFELNKNKDKDNNNNEIRDNKIIDNEKENNEINNEDNIEENDEENEDKDDSDEHSEDELITY